MRRSEGSAAEKNEKFCSTRNQVVCNKRKPVSKSIRVRSISWFTYENTTCHLFMLIRVCTDFARAISTAKTSSSCSRNKSGRTSADKPGRGGAGACYKRAARATCSTATWSAWTTRSCRTTSCAWTTRCCSTTRSAWTTRSCGTTCCTGRAGYRHTQPWTARRRESCRSGCECRTFCFAHSRNRLPCR
jgi:hypothetical protein